MEDKKSKKSIVVMIMLITITIGIIAIVNAKSNGDGVISSFDIVYEYEYNNGKVIYEGYQGNSIIVCSNDGIKLMTLKGDTLWDYAYSIRMPRLKTKGNYIAVADYSGQSIYLFDGKGLVNKILTNYKIIEFDINERGFVSIVEENRNENNLYLYTTEGDLIARSKTVFDRNGYPLDIAISNDGTKLVTSYLFTDGINLESRITFYQFSNVGQNYNERIAGSFRIENTIIPKVEFVDNNTVAAFSDSGITIYEMTEKPDKKSDIHIEEEIKSIVQGKSFLGVVTGDGEQILQTFNYKGEKLGESIIDIKYTNVVSNDEDIIFYNEWGWEIHSRNGRLRHKETFDYSVQQVVPINNNDYLIVSIKDTKIIKLR
ncbi:hypothetical protein EDC18_11281 [Natranaerovirga pectinivora]|uniref:Uncharacterized protein n=1 Tax=Natranaerovirga pectinivora TaxID=682400 RepID=A0A4R3MGJ0_9FIRM|nr:DUF5711 family protein [Natranaerovirga pectinivora]TCT12309.1 hypothetical protein EDC18_11281 [Natranaerovirga pectinivora]